MLITDHAIRRYKQRVGKRTASKRRIFTRINKDLEQDVQERRPSKVPNCYILITSKYKAVCHGKKVLTICSLETTHTIFEDEYVFTNVI